MQTKNKGELYGECGRLSCQNDQAVCFNRHRRFYVCVACAKKINQNQKEGDEPHCLIPEKEK